MEDSFDDYNDFLKRAREEYGKSYYEEIAKERGVPFVDLMKFKPETEALARVPYAIAIKHNVLPLRYASKALFVAMSDPNDTSVSDDVRLACRCTVKPVLADPQSIRAAISRFYGEQNKIE